MQTLLDTLRIKSARILIATHMLSTARDAYPASIRRVEERLIDVGDASLHVGVTGIGPDVIVLTGGPGCVQYLEQDHLAPKGFRSWYPEPRGVGRSGGGPHTMEQAVADLEAIRHAVGVS
jgi:proline iminopeptidase